MSIDGPHDNVLVMKPPMCFSQRDGERFISALDSVLATVEDRRGATLLPTPT